jgi:hypothetical protein
MSAAQVVPPLPPGYKLDSGEDQTIPPLPDGYKLDNSVMPRGASTATATDKVGQFIDAWWKQVNPSGMVDAAQHPVDTAVNMSQAQGDLALKAKASFDKGHYVEGLRHFMNYMVPVIGQQSDLAGDQLDQGKIAEGMGTTAGAATNIAAPELIKGTYKLPEAAQGVAEKMYQSALKPSTAANSSAEIKNMVKTGLDAGIPVSAEGAAKLNGLISELGDKVKAQIAANPNAPVNKFKVASRLSDTAKKFGTQVNPETDLQSITDSGNEFLRNQPNQIPAADAQALKQGTYRQIKDKNYGDLSTATKEAQKSLARGIKEELEAQFPEIKGLNADQAKFINLDGALEKAVERIANRNLFGISTPLTMAGMGAVGAAFGPQEAGSAALAAGVIKMALEDPAIKSKLAIAINKGGKGSITMGATTARMAGYMNALANASSILAQKDESPDKSQSQ